MSVCDVPLCPNISAGGTHTLNGALKGVPRVNRNVNETRDRLRIRLHQRKESLNPKQPPVPLNSVNGVPGIRTQIVTADKTTNKTTNNQSAFTFNEESITNMIKKAGIETFTKKHRRDLAAKGSTVKKIDTKAFLELKSKTIAMARDKENKPLVDDMCKHAANFLRRNTYEIEKILNYIEGKQVDKIPHKKAVKKSRQKEKKEVERRKKEEEDEARHKAEEERIRKERRQEEEKLKAELLAKNAAIKKNKKKIVQPVLIQNETTKSKKKNKKVDSEPEHYEETIPAMVTIKRIVENNNSPPTVTITLKGSTPDQDKLLYTLVNGHNNRNSVTAESKSSDPPSNNKKEDNKNNKKKKKNNDKTTVTTTTTTTTKEMKVTLAVDKSFRKELENKAARLESNQVKNKVNHQMQQQQQYNTKEARKQSGEVKVKAKDNIIDIPSLKLPPGITITKVNGPLTNRKSNNVQSSDYQNVPVNKSGVIVVETEKLMLQSVSGSKKGKKKKKKAKQEGNSDQQEKPSSSGQPTGMVTLKNPIFHKLQNKLVPPTDSITTPLINMNEQATISPGANGMVTIRRSRPIALQNESPLSEFLQPIIHNSSPMPPTIQLSDKTSVKEERKSPCNSANSNLSNNISSNFDSQRLSAQNILMGLPGIQITRVNKNAINDIDNCEQQAADVSIIRTSGFNLEKDDWPYESVFTPKDILEDDLDEGERELEAFKRFCQQSVPPKHKEKVAHLNVKDIVLMKKNDVTYS